MTINNTTNNKAFIGMSLDGKLFSRKWLRYALCKLVDKHSEILFLLADDLLRYTRTAKKDNDQFTLNIYAISNLVHQRSSEFQVFIKSEVEHLKEKQANKIVVRRWDDFADKTFVYILRNIIIAYNSIRPFRSLVNEVATSHYNKVKKNNIETFYNSVIAYLLDEISMCIRITEVGNYHYEYYPGDQNKIICRLYNDDFLQYGLTIESILGITEKKRQFSALIYPDKISHE